MPEVDVSDYKKLMVDLKGAEKSVRLQMRSRLRSIAQPLGEKVVEVGSRPMPSRGGLAGNLAGARVSVSITGSSVSLRLGGRKHRGGEAQLDQIDGAGILRHPVFGRAGDSRRSWRWTTQGVPSGTYTKAFLDEADQVRDDLAKEVERILEEVGP